MSIVAVAGGFDPLHLGHILHIEEALKLGDELLIILARDDQLDIKNGHAIDYYEREFILNWGLRGRWFKVVPNIDAGIECADSLRYYRPNIFAKGGDRTPENMPKREVEVCEEIGCAIIYGVGGSIIHHSSWIKKRLRR